MLKTLDLHPSANPSHYDTCMGMLALLGATSAFGGFSLTHAVGVLHCALKTENFRIYLGRNDRPSAALLWAFLDDEARTEYLQKGYLADVDAWNSGSELWFLHVIAEGGKIKDLIEDTKTAAPFAAYNKGYMLRRSRSGKRRIISVSRDGIRLSRTL